MTTFFRILDAPIDAKAGALRAAIVHQRSHGEPAPVEGIVFECDPSAFFDVPGAPFAYWVTDAVRGTFKRFDRVESTGRTVKQGLATADDFRFVRLYWEVGLNGLNSGWRSFAKGGAFSPVYADVPLVLEWRDNGSILKAKVVAEHGNVGKRIYNEEFFGRAGLTWPRRTQAGFGIRIMPTGCIFADKGPAVFVEEDAPETALALLALLTSAPFRFLVSLQMAFGSYEVGVIQRTPVPRLTSAEARMLEKLCRQAWSLKRSIDTSNEASHAFLLPAVISKSDRDSVEAELVNLQTQIDEEAFRLYGIGAADRAAIEFSTGNVPRDTGDSDDSDESDDEPSDAGVAVALESDQLSSWLVGVAFGRFDPRLATGERALPPEPDPFDPLPSRSPGMYPDSEESAHCPELLVDDEGHADDLTALVQAVAERVKVEVPENLRDWLAKEFFRLHIKMYSKSRRKAPIYWQLATPSASYSVLLYIHTFSKDTLFRVQNDYAVPKLAHEERRLESLSNELRDGATAAQRKQLAAQEAVIEELRAFLAEVKRVAPLWNPNLDDGVIINFAPLWRLVPQNKSWQKELKSTWDALCEGEYDWAHLAMHLWPERVVPKCAKDRSLAIAHGLEDVFWVEGTDGKWIPRKTPTKSVDELVKERTSTAAKSSLKSLLEAPIASGTAAKPKKAPRKGNAHA